ncbi:hypothetical protein B0H15DRAFT_793425, partial [Mycena belliarum]
FQEIPRDIRVGLLYDVACGLERSCRRWGFLERYIDRLEFAQFRCFTRWTRMGVPIDLSPKEREGFGFTNGRAASASGTLSAT